MQNRKKRTLLAFATCLIFGLMGTLKAQTPPQPAAANAPKNPGNIFYHSYIKLKWIISM